MREFRKILIFFIFLSLIILIILVSNKNENHYHNNKIQNKPSKQKFEKTLQTSAYSLYIKDKPLQSPIPRSHSNLIYYSKEIKSNGGNQQQRSEFAYSFYTTNENYFCSALIISNNIRKWSNYDIVIHIVGNYQDYLDDEIMNNFMKLENVYFRFVSNLSPNNQGNKNSFWGQSWNKIWVFKLIEYKRIINLDADLYLKKNLDHLFQSIPDESTLAMPRAYWLPQPRATTLLIVLKPSNQLFDNIISIGNNISMHDHFKNKNVGYWDMDILNSMFIENMEFTMLPGIYGLLHDEFSTSLRQWLKKDIKQTWDNAPLFHWSSWKPWSMNENSYDVLNHGDYFKKSWTLWYEGKNKYCK